MIQTDEDDEKVQPLICSCQGGTQGGSPHFYQSRACACITIPADATRLLFSSSCVRASSSFAYSPRAILAVVVAVLIALASRQIRQQRHQVQAAVEDEALAERQRQRQRQ